MRNREPNKPAAEGARGMEKGRVAPLESEVVSNAKAETERFEIKRILAAVDFSEESVSALRCAAEVAEMFDASVFLLHVIEDRWLAEGRPGAADLLVAPRKAEDVVAEKLAALARREAPSFVPVSPVVRTGKPFMEAAEEARRLRADLIVVATRGLTGLRHVLLGSTAERIVRHAPCAVLAARGGPRIKIAKRIMAAVDFSESSKLALGRAADLAKRTGAKLSALHVVDVYRRPGIDEMPGPGKEKSLGQEAAKRLKEWARSEIPVEVEWSPEIRLGQPVYEIVSSAADLGCDLVVAGARGKSGLEHFLLGSTVERVMRYASQSVLAVRQPEETK